MALKDWVPLLQHAGELTALLDPALLLVECLCLQSQPSSEAAQEERHVLGDYLALALKCTGQLRARPPLDEVCRQLRTLRNDGTSKEGNESSGKKPRDRRRSLRARGGLDGGSNWGGLGMGRPR